MKDTKFLDLMAEHAFHDYSACTSLRLAIEYWERGQDAQSWSSLFFWCMTRDAQEALWEQLSPHYFDGLLLKWGGV